MQEGVVKPFRPVIIGSLTVCLAIAIAPWFSGGQEPIAMLLDAGALLLGMLLVWRQPEVRSLASGPLVVTYTALVGFALLSLLWTVNRYSTITWVVQWVIAGLAFRLAYILAGEKKGREWVIGVYLVSASVFSLTAIGLYLTTSYSRLTGFIYWPNPAAGYLIPAMVLMLDHLRRARGRRAVSLWLAVSVLIGGTFVLTDSRGAGLVLAFIVVLYCLVVETNRQFWIRFVSVIVLGFALSYGLLYLSKFTVQHSLKIAPGSRLAQVASGESESLSDRLYYAESAVEIWFAHPLAGTGAGTYGDVHPQFQKRVVSASTNAHNYYLQTLAELGIVGAILLGALVLWLLAGALRGAVLDHSLIPVVLGASGLLMHFALDIDANYPAILALCGVLLGLAYEQWSASRKPVSWRLPAVAALLLVPTANIYQEQGWAAKALASQNAGDYALAATQFASAHSGLVYDPEYLDAEGIDYYTIAEAGSSETSTAEALALDKARLAERMAPADGQNYQLEGRVLALEDKLPQSEKALRYALRLDPYNHPVYALDLASVQLLAGDERGALATAHSMLALYPNSVVQIRQLDMTLRPALGNLAAVAGNIYLKEGDLKAAGQAGEQSLEYDPGNLRGEALLHQVHKRGG